MKLAVMQPYIFPYIGYFQMVNVVDKFIFYDDVNYIKQGWINRNKILVSGKGLLFTVPLIKPTSFALINKTEINFDIYPSWKLKFLQTLKQSYTKAPHFNAVYDLVEEILSRSHDSISALAIDSIRSVSEYLLIKTDFKISSENYRNQGLEKQNRLIDICKVEGANHYINAAGGQELYNQENFQKVDINLDFITSLPVEYKQFENEFVPWLSIIDVLMFNNISEVGNMLGKYEFIK